MGEPDVFSWGKTNAVGVGVSFCFRHGALEFDIVIPFFGFGIHFRKTENNDWF